MSGPRATWAALGMALALGAAYWGWTHKLKPAREKRVAEAKKPFSGLEPAATSEVLLRKKGSPEVLLRRVDGAWRLVKPVAAPADTQAVEGLIKALADLSNEETIAEQGADLRQYGLDDPSGAVTFQPASPGAKPQVLFFGRDNPTGSYAYAMVDGRPEVFLTWLWVKNSVLKDADGLRDKAVWRFEPAAVQEARSTHAGGFSLRRGEAGWSVRRAAGEEPGRAEAIDAWLGELSRLRALSVPSEDGRGGDWGLASGPRLGLRLADGQTLELRVGKARDEDGYYAQAGPGGPVFVLPAHTLPTVRKVGQDLADRRAFKLDPSGVQRFEVVRPSGRLSASRAAGTWAWDGASPQGGEGYDFDGLVARFSGAELLQRLPLADKPAKPEASVFFYGAAGQVLEAAELGPRRGKGQVAYSAEKRAVTLVSPDLLDGLPAPPSAEGQTP